MRTPSHIQTEGFEVVNPETTKLYFQENKKGVIKREKEKGT